MGPRRIPARQNASAEGQDAENVFAAAGGVPRSPPLNVQGSGAVVRSPPQGGVPPPPPLPNIQPASPPNLRRRVQQPRDDPPPYDVAVEPPFMPVMQEILLHLRRDAQLYRQVNEQTLQEFRLLRQELAARAPLQQQAPPANQQQAPPANQQQAPPANQQQAPPAHQQQVPPAHQQQAPPAHQQQVPPAHQQQAPPVYQQQVPPAQQNQLQPIAPPQAQQGVQLPPFQRAIPPFAPMNLQGRQPPQQNGGNAAVGFMPYNPPQQIPHPPMHHLRTVEVPKYSGAAEVKTPYDFLVELEKYRTISRSTDEFLLREIVPTALQDNAWHWWRQESVLNPFVDWNDFKIRFRREFQALGYNEHMRRALERRTQGPSEPLTMFIRVIIDFYERLNERPTEQEIIQRIRRQIHPEYAQILHGKVINTINELKEAAFQAQEIIKMSRLYEPPPTYNPIEPSLAWQPVGAQQFTPQRSSLPVEENLNPRVNFASVDPFHFHHSEPQRRVTIQEANRSPPPLRPATPAAVPAQQQRQRRDSTGSDQGERRCYVCQSNEHLANRCPRRPQSPNSGNGRSPSPRRR